MYTKIIAEGGINHNGDINIAKKLIDVAVVAGCDYIKWQKRNPDECVPEDQKNKPKSTPWGDMSYLEYKKRIEFERSDYYKIFDYCGERIKCFASVWDKDSANFMSLFTNVAKIPSALITDIELCQYARERFKTLIISTGMSTEEEVVKCIEKCDPDVIMHTNSTYPSSIDELNLNYINHLKLTWTYPEIGYSGHEYGLATTFAAVAMGASWIERHITLDRNMWGSDQSASVEPSGVMKLVRGIRNIDKARAYDSGPRKLFKSEVAKRKSLRKV